MANPTRSSNGANSIDSPAMDRLAVSTFRPPRLISHSALGHGMEFVSFRSHVRNA